MSKTNPPSAASNAGWNAFSTIWSITISFVLAPLLIRYLGTSSYGLLLLVWSITGVLGVMNFGLGEATLRYVALYYGKGDLIGVNRVFGSTMSFYLLIGSIVCGLIFLGAHEMVTWMVIPPDKQTTVTWMLRISALVFSMGIIARAFLSVPMALHRFDITSKISVGQTVIRSGGYILLVFLKFGILALILWDLLVGALVLLLQIKIARDLIPGIKLRPSYSFGGLREIVGYSVASFLTYLFHTLHREGGKLLLARLSGPAAVAYLGTPDNIVQRLHMVVASGSETLMPRFSATSDKEVARQLFWTSTWASLVVSLIFFIPLFVLMPDFLRLWISPEFSKESAPVGQFLALALIAQGTFAPAATYYRGIGKPSFVTWVIFAAALTTITFSIVLIPKYGLVGVGYAYFISSICPLLGTIFGWIFAFGRTSVVPLLRRVGLPLLLGFSTLPVEQVIRGYFGDLTWLGLLLLWVLFTGLVGLLIFGADFILGGSEAPSQNFLQWIGQSKKVQKLTRILPFRPKQ